MGMEVLVTAHPNQCQRMLQRLQRGPATSWELQQLGVCSHTSRISELRKAGYKIDAVERWRGRKKIVTYYLMGQLNLPMENVA